MNAAEMKGKRIAILGTGREGMSVLRYLRLKNPGQVFTLVDEKEPASKVLEQFGEHHELRILSLDETGLDDFDVLIRSPGISPYRKAIRSAVQAGVEVVSPSTLWFAEHPRAKTICITGTKGKSTTSSLVAHLLASAGLNVRLAGNIGRPLLDCDDRGVDWWVIELSSYQLADLEARPDISVLLNLSPEHLDWHGNEAVYFADKLRLAGLADERTLVVNAAEPVLVDAVAFRKGTVWFNRPDAISARGGKLFSGSRELETGELPGLPGHHNLSNAAAALTIATAAGVGLEQAVNALHDYRALPHRLHLLGESAGIKFVNDSISSTPVATAAALESLQDKVVTLIVGGLDRGVDWSPYMTRFRQFSPMAVIGVPDSGERIIGDLARHGIKPEAGLHAARNLEDAICLARSVTPAGGTVLLSPGSPSFPQFRDYRDRGRQFARFCGFELAEEELRES